MATRAHINELFLRARELSGEAREAFIAAASEDDEAIHGELMNLLKADHDATELLRPPDADAVAQWSGGASPRRPDRVGDTIAGCRLLRVVGRGGMGVVYEAEQDQP